MTAEQVRSEERPRNIVEAGKVAVGFCHGCREMKPLLSLDIMGFPATVDVCQPCIEAWAAKFGGNGR